MNNTSIRPFMEFIKLSLFLLFLNVCFSHMLSIKYIYLFKYKMNKRIYDAGKYRSVYELGKYDSSQIVKIIKSPLKQKE